MKGLNLVILAGALATYLNGANAHAETKPSGGSRKGKVTTQYFEDGGATLIFDSKWSKKLWNSMKNVPVSVNKDGIEEKRTNGGIFCAKLNLKPEINFERIYCGIVFEDLSKGLVEL